MSGAREARPPAPCASERLKRTAAERAAERVLPGMRIGLGTGSTVARLLDVLGERAARGELEGVVGVPTSVQTAERARELGIRLAELDEVGPGLDLIKGLGGALLREKMVAQASGALMIIVDESKLVGRLGERAPLPVEVVRFGWRAHMALFRELGSDPVLRRLEDGSPFVTDNGNYMVDCRFPDGIEDPTALEETLRRRAGVVEDGLFLGMASAVVVAGERGVTVLERGGR